MNFCIRSVNRFVRKQYQIRNNKEKYYLEANLLNQLPILTLNNLKITENILNNNKKRAQCHKEYLLKINITDN